jgi:hypothetical protein
MNAHHPPLNTHVFNFTPQENGGESLSLTTTIHHNGDVNDDGTLQTYLNQQLTLHSYCNSATFDLSTAILTPDLLRQLANELESLIVKSNHKKISMKRLSQLQRFV